MVITPPKAKEQRMSDYEYSEDQPWEPEFNRMPSDERQIIIHIADQLGKRQYFNAIRKIGELIQVCVRNQQKLIREID